jgi:hypothetical protein
MYDLAKRQRKYKELCHFEKSRISERDKPLDDFLVIVLLLPWLENAISQILRKKNGLISATNI